VAFAVVLNAIQKLDILYTLQVWIPSLRLIVRANHILVHCILSSRPLSPIAQRPRTQDPSCPTYDEAHRSRAPNQGQAAVLAGATENGAIEKSSIQGRDLLTLLVKANMVSDIPGNQRLSDEDVLARTLR
jgi:hypothetical protein